MKSDKFCEILREICWTAELSPEEIPDADALGRLVKTEMPKGGEEPLLVFFQTCDEQGKALPSVIRMSRKEEDGCQEDFRKLHTGEMGYAAVFLKEGEWEFEASHGPFFCVAKKSLCLERQQTVVSFALQNIAPEWTEGWIAGDIHHHSIYSSRLFGGTDPVTESPAEVGSWMRAAGLSFGALSDHHNILNHPAWEKTSGQDFLPIVSKEISTSRGHVMALNAPEDVTFRIPDVPQRTDGYMREEFKRTINQIHKCGGMAQLNHPTDRQTAISWNPAYMDMISLFDTVEIWNGSKPMIEGTSSADAIRLWLELLEQGVYLPAVTGTDTHNALNNDYDILVRVLRKQMQEKEDWGKWEKLLGTLALWKRRNLGTGAVFTMIHPQNPQDAHSVTEELQNGRAVLSSGPLMRVFLGEREPGRKSADKDSLSSDVTLYRGAKELKILLRSNRKLEFVLLLWKGGGKRRYNIRKWERQEEGYWDYSHTVSEEQLGKWGVRRNEGDYLVVIAGKDFSCMAISNPIFI